MASKTWKSKNWKGESINEKYSIGYNDTYNHFRKVWNELGYTMKFVTIEEVEDWINNKCDIINNPSNIYKIMEGHKIIKEVVKENK